MGGDLVTVTSSPDEPPAIAAAPPERVDDRIVVAPERLERRGRAWLLWSFLLCPCHLPLTLGVLVAVAGGTTVGGLLRDNLFAAGVVVTATWLAGTGYGLSLVRRAERSRGSCPLPEP